MGGGGPNIWRTSVLLVGPVIPLFQSQDGSLYLRALLNVCNGFLRFTSGLTPVDPWTASMAAKLFDPHTCTCVYRYWWDSNTGRVCGTVCFLIV